MAQSASVLEAFDGLRVCEVVADWGEKPASFRAKFQSIAASLEPDERIKLMVFVHKDGVELLKAVLADPQANKVCSLQWEYDGKEDVNLVIPLLINNCPELALLRVEFRNPFCV
ncbi:hypothetical protein BASA81_015296 [Batrachochytrium salamandrivorans]|nr:hypothetical protein BASA81_015296 [Batrachochytrium salamandrivorans]